MKQLNIIFLFSTFLFSSCYYEAVSPYYQVEMSELVIVNNTYDDYFEQLYIAPVDQYEWGGNYLHNELNPGHQFRDYFYPGNYDIKVITYNGYEYTMYDVYLYGYNKFYMPEYDKMAKGKKNSKKK